MSWKRSDVTMKKEYGSVSPKYEGRPISHSISSSKSKKFSVSRSRSYSRSRKKDTRRKRSVSRSKSRSGSASGSYPVSAERNPPIQMNPNHKRPALDFLIFVKKHAEQQILNALILKKVLCLLITLIYLIKKYFQKLITCNNFNFYYFYYNLNKAKHSDVINQ